MNRVLACDLDGVIFDFNAAYINEMNKRYNAGSPFASDTYPTTWYYLTDGNYVTKEQDKEFWSWAANEGNYEFWTSLPSYPGAQEFLRRAFKNFNDVWFVTSRPGKRVKQATTDALKRLGVNEPRVIISSYKVPDMIGVGATDFLDDRDKNFEDVLLWGNQEGDVRIKGNLPKGMNGTLNQDLGIKLWMLDRPYNRHFNHPNVQRIHSIFEVL